jgi:hypothetical protein
VLQSPAGQYSIGANISPSDWLAFTLTRYLSIRHQPNLSRPSLGGLAGNLRFLCDTLGQDPTKLHQCRIHGQRQHGCIRVTLDILVLGRNRLQVFVERRQQVRKDGFLQVGVAVSAAMRFLKEIMRAVVRFGVSVWQL